MNIKKVIIVGAVVVGAIILWKNKDKIFKKSAPAPAKDPKLEQAEKTLAELNSILAQWNAFKPTNQGEGMQKQSMRQSIDMKLTNANKDLMPLGYIIELKEDKFVLTKKS